jgi:hypothetical protein
MVLGGKLLKIVGFLYTSAFEGNHIFVKSACYHLVKYLVLKLQYINFYFDYRIKVH